MRSPGSFSGERNCAVLQHIFEQYEKSVKEVDMERSARVEAGLKSKIDRRLDQNPLLLYAKVVKEQTGAQVTFSSSKTALSEFTLQHMVAKLGWNWGKGEYLYKDDSIFNFEGISTNQTTLERFISLFKQDMAVRYSTTPQKIIIQSIVKGSARVNFFYPNGIPDK